MYIPVLIFLFPSLFPAFPPPLPPPPYRVFLFLYCRNLCGGERAILDSHVIGLTSMAAMSPSFESLGIGYYKPPIGLKYGIAFPAFL